MASYQHQQAAAASAAMAAAAAAHTITHRSSSTGSSYQYRSSSNSMSRSTWQQQLSTLLVGVLTVAGGLSSASAQHHSQQAAKGASFSGWKSGRASFYGDDGGTTIHQGSCMLGYLDPNKGTGWDIGALSDVDPDYYGSCGRCYEVACVPSTFKDGYGNSLDRTGVCKDPSKTVTVRITDSCPCVYPNNAFSNKRWCCGDMPHLDLSTQAFQKLADVSQGVMGMRYRPVQCPP